MKEVGIGLAGFGTVGAGVVEGLLTQGELITRRCGVSVTLRAIADLDVTTSRGIEVPKSVALLSDAMALVEREDVQVVVELIGGTGVAYRLIRAAEASG